MNIEKEKTAIERLRAFEPETEPYYLCYSGGKDSDVIRILAELAGVKHEIHHNHTTVDAPETVRYVRSIPGVIVDYPEITMWELIPKNSVPPNRFSRYCCSVLKERGGKGRMRITGVRWEESPQRKQNKGLVNIVGKPVTTAKAADALGVDYTVNSKNGIILHTDNDENRRFVEQCYRDRTATINPIIDWTDEDVWEFLSHHGCNSNPLYRCGYARVGCVGCPLKSTRLMRTDFKRWPAYYRAYLRAFDKMLVERKKRGAKTNGLVDWQTGEDVMRWWLREEDGQ